MRYALSFLLFFMVGVPLNEPLMAGAALMAGVVIFCGEVRRDRRTWAILVLLLGLACLLHGTFPRTQIPQGQNVFVEKGDGEPLSQTLPPPVYKAMHDDFLQAYPVEKRCDPKAGGCWLAGGVPSSPFAFSADDLWHQGPLSRFVATIDFKNIRDIGAGFINDSAYNWFWTSDLQREHAPFFVVYDVPESLQGSRLCWQGPTLWEVEDHTYTSLRHDTVACKDITANDVNKRLYAYSFSPVPLTMKLEKSLTLRVLDGAYDALRLLLLVLFVGVGVKIKPRALPYPLFCMFSMLLMVAFLHPVFIWGTPLFSGGDDGLTHHGFSRAMLQALMRGDWVETLRGVESVYYFMPGLRYVLMLEQALFGEKVYLTLLVIALFPLVIGWVLGLLTTPALGRKGALLFVALGFVPVTLVAKILAAYGFSAYTFLTIGLGGFPEPFGYLTFLTAFGCVVMGLEKRASIPWWMGAGLVLALSVFLRPNLAVAAAVLIPATSFMLIRERRWVETGALGTGFSTLALVPLHNFVFGHTFVPLTAAATIKENLLTPPSTYLHAASTFLGIGNDPWAPQKVGEQILNWLVNLGNGPIDVSFLGRFGSGTLQHVLFMMLFLFAALVKLPVLAPLGASLISVSRRLRLAALVCVGLQAPLFFYHPAKRYAFLAWLLTLVVAVAWYWHLSNRRKQTQGFASAF